MNKVMLNTTPTLYEPKKAAAIAKALQSGDDEWTYKAVDLGTGWARIDVFDEDGEFVASHNEG